MNTTQSAGQAAPQGQPRPPFFRPEQMRNLPDQFSPEEKKKWEHGLTMLYKQMNENPPDSQTHQDSKKKIQDFSQTLQKKLQQSANRPQGNQVQNRPSNAGQPTQTLQPPQSQQPQADGNAPPQNVPQPSRPAQGAPSKVSETMMNHVEKFPYALPTGLFPGTPEAQKWLQDTKTRYLKALSAMENFSAQVKNIENTYKERQAQGKPLNPEEQKEYVSKKEVFQKHYADAKRWVESFRRSQTEQNNAQNAGPGQQQPSNPQQQPINNGIAIPPRPTMNLQQQAPNQQAMQSTATVQAAMQAARNQQLHGPTQTNGGSMMMQPQGIPQDQGVQIKEEGGTHQPPPQPHINTAVAAVSQPRPTQNSPHSAVPQSASATSNGNPKPLSQQEAVAHAARTYSSSQTASTPNVMASHTHPSLPRETPIVSTNRMPIPKQLPPGAIGPPQPVSMQPARPTYSGGPNNSGNGTMGQPVLAKTPGFTIGGDENRIMNKRKLDELVRQVTGGGEGLDSSEGLTPEVEDCVLSVADEFVDQVITAACKCAKARGAKQLEIRDIQLILERNYNIRIPGYASDEIRTVRKFQPAQGWIAKMSAIQAAKVTGGKGDL